MNLAFEVYPQENFKVVSMRKGASFYGLRKPCLRLV